MCYLNTRLRQPRCHCNADLFRNRFAITKKTRLIYKMYQFRHLAYMLDLQMSALIFVIVYKGYCMGIIFNSG